MRIDICKRVGGHVNGVVRERFWKSVRYAMWDSAGCLDVHAHTLMPMVIADLVREQINNDE